MAGYGLRNRLFLAQTRLHLYSRHFVSYVRAALPFIYCFPFFRVYRCATVKVILVCRMFACNVCSESETKPLDLFLFCTFLWPAICQSSIDTVEWMQIQWNALGLDWKWRATITKKNGKASTVNRIRSRPRLNRSATFARSASLYRRSETPTPIAASTLIANPCATTTHSIGGHSLEPSTPFIGAMFNANGCTQQQIKQKKVNRRRTLEIIEQTPWQRMSRFVTRNIALRRRR